MLLAQIAERDRREVPSHAFAPAVGSAIATSADAGARPLVDVGASSSVSV